MKPTITLTPNQQAYNKCLRNKQYDIVIAAGPAGTGKTKLAVEAGLDMVLKERQYKKLIVTRPVTYGRDDIGFMPGDLKSKMSPWIAPIIDAASESNTPFKWDVHNTNKDHPQNANMEIVPFNFMRGRTFKNAWIICDETQNCTTEQLLMLLTRIGQNSKMVITGDPFQCDISDSGFLRFLDNYSELDPKTETSRLLLERVALIKFTRDDIKRHELIPHLIGLCAPRHHRP